MKRKYFLTQKTFYKQENKSGKLLAKALCAKKANTTICQMQGNDGSIENSNADIASHFEQYYTISPRAYTT